MAWYDKYYNQITLNDGYYLDVKKDKVYPAASKCIHPRGTHTVQWFEYYWNDITRSYTRVYKKDTPRKFRYLSKSNYMDKYPEDFI